MICCPAMNRGNGLTKSEKIEPPKIRSAIRSAADEFFVIDKGHTEVVVHYGKSTELLESYNTTKDIVEKRKLLKQLGRYSISLYSYQLDKLKKNHAIDDESYKGLTVLKNSFYDEIIGLNI